MSRKNVHYRKQIGYKKSHPSGGGGKRFTMEKM